MDVNVAAQEEDPDSVLNFYRKAIALRKELSCVKDGNHTEYNKRSSSLYTYSRQDSRQKILVVCSFTEKEVPFKAPQGWKLNDAQLILQNYQTVDAAVMNPYEVRVYLWNK